MTGIMKHDGYTARIEYDSEAKVFYGEVLHLRDVITFEGTSVHELEEEFQNSLQDYIEWCAEQGQAPEKPFSGQFVTRTTPEVHRGVATIAGNQGKSLNAYVIEAIQEKLHRDQAIQYFTGSAHLLSHAVKEPITIKVYGSAFKETSWGNVTQAVLVKTDTLTAIPMGEQSKAEVGWTVNGAEA